MRKRVLTLSTIVAGCLSMASSWAAGESRPGPVRVFTHAYLIDGRGGAPIADATVIVRGANVEAVGPAASVRVPPGSEIEDLHGRALLPGLADMHVHLVGGWDGHAVDLLGYHRYLNSLLYAGVTTVLDTGNVQPYIVQLRAEVAAGRLVGPRIYCVGPLVDGADPVWPPLSYAISSLGQVAPAVQALKRDQVDLIKGYVGLSHSVLRRLVQEGQKVGLRVIVDQWQRNGSSELVDDGIYGFAHLPTRQLTAQDVDYLKEHHTVFISTLTVFESASRRRLANLDFLKDPLVADTTPPSFLAGLRALIYLTAGSLGVVSPARFFIYDGLGALISVPIVVSLGYLFGAQIETIIHYLGGFENIIWIVVILSLLLYGTRLLISASQERDAGST